MPVPAGGATEPDRLATIEDLAAKLQRGVDDLDEASALLAIEGATAVVQAVTLQRLVRVDDDTVTVPGGCGLWLRLPERPIISVSSVTYDGTLLASTAYRLSRGQLWRDCGWSSAYGTPVDVSVVYSHGYDLDAQDIQFARSVTAGLAAGSYEQPGGGAVQREQIDDYSVAYTSAAAAMEASPALMRLLRSKYGRKAAMVAVY